VTYFLYVEHLKRCCFQAIEARMRRPGGAPMNRARVACKCGRAAFYTAADQTWKASRKA
jgi:hypothetical protein